jgi:hypothetical protein
MIRYAEPVTKPCNETPDVTKPVTKVLEERGLAYAHPEFIAVMRDVLAGKPRVGRPPAGAVAMSGAERVKHRERLASKA